MKKIILLILLLSPLVLLAQGIDAPWWGVRGGVNFSKLSSEYYSTEYLTGFSIGGVYCYPISKSIPIYIESGIYFQQRGARDNGFLTESGETSRLLTHEIEVPLLLGCHVSLARPWAIQAAVGFYYSVALNGSFKIGNNKFDPYDKELLQTLRDAAPKEQQLLHRSDFGLRVGVSASYYRYLFGLTFDGGLLNLYAPDLRKVGYQALASCFTLQIGYNF
ncbi:MAG: porin family protein [Rikenellaceae bacterium]